MIKKKRILIAPLDWGLGHATRCIPIIKLLLQNNTEVIIAADKRPLELLKNEFPQLEFVVLPGYDISYPRSGSMALQMFWQIPKILTAIKREHAQLENIIEQYKIDAVISDNRYGLWSKTFPCVFITHQLNIKSQSGEGLLYKINKKFINKYTECWVPDFEGESNLSGDLSHKKRKPANTYFIGPLSRFTNTTGTAEKKQDILVILSGPEPQRSIFEKIILDQLQTTRLKCLIVQGIPEKKEAKKINNTIEVVSHLDAEELNKTIIDSELIISRPGYSTIMDLAVLGKKAILVPTPGQTEQEYLAEKLKLEKVAYSISQNKFNLVEALKESENYMGFIPMENNSAKLKNRLEKLLK